MRGICVLPFWLFLGAKKLPGWSRCSFFHAVLACILELPPLFIIRLQFADGRCLYLAAAFG